MNIYSIRRNRLLKELKNNACVILFSGNEIMKSEDEAYDFCVNNNFYYLTGIDAEGMALMLTKNNDNVMAKMFILPYDENLAKWVGGRMKKEEVTSISEIENVYDINDLNAHFASFYNHTRGKRGFSLYLDLWHYNFNQETSLGHNFAREVKEKYPSIQIKDIYSYITQLRLIKDEYEISCIKKAINITKQGIEVMMQNIKPYQNEMFMEGVFQFALMRNLCRETSFKTIAASGKRATILHYSDNNNIMQDGELFLCDLGATYQKYKADISRTFPVNGKFSDRQKEIYEIVLNAQKIVQENAKPGISLRELNQLVIDYYKEELPKHGLLKDVNEYYFHGVSHHLGLDTHDVNGGLGDILKKGMVITNEPGLYIEDESIGIRIEDDLLITDEGSENLSQDIIKQIEDIEKAINA